MLVSKKDPAQESGTFLFAWIVIMLISSLMLPIVLVYFIQDAIHFSKLHWLFKAPPSAYIAFMCGMLMITAGMIVYLIIKVKTDKKPVFLVSLIIILLSSPLFYTSLNTYYYFDQEGLHYRELWSLGQSNYKWKDFKQVHAVFDKKPNRGSTLKEYEFVISENKTIVIPVDTAFMENRQRINASLEENKVPLDNNLADFYE
ncbi:hypothetical protein [Falsibacillus pallidus]|uniref:hypothetical protein n=1 Tax=Falsibacillus pallidus TaxID=493781 RepID=UPI003D9929B9